MLSNEYKYFSYAKILHLTRIRHVGVKYNKKKIHCHLFLVPLAYDFILEHDRIYIDFYSTYHINR